MKSPILLLAILFALLSCGEKGETAKTNFNLKLGAAVTTPAAFTGGLLLTGRRTDGSQKFMLALTNELELTLQKGAWEFATIAWTAPIAGKKMTGPHICSYQQVEIRDDNQSVTFNMNLNNCHSASVGQPNAFSESQYYSILNSGSSTIGFKRLALLECSTIDIDGSCSMAYGSSTFQSYKIVIPSFAVGIQASSVQDLSECGAFSSGTDFSNFQIPIGGANGFIRTNIKMFQNSSCIESGSSTSSYSYAKGFANAVPNYSMLSPSFDPTLSNAYFNYISQWNAGGIVSTTGRLKGDLLLITATSTTVPPANTGDYVYFNGTSFQQLPATGINIVDGKVYFNDQNVYMFIKP